jgi:hypothetical protein
MAILWGKVNFYLNKSRTLYGEGGKNLIVIVVLNGEIHSFFEERNLSFFFRKN